MQILTYQTDIDSLMSHNHCLKNTLMAVQDISSAEGATMHPCLARFSL